MKSCFLARFAALALVASTCSALTVTQTLTISATGSKYGSGIIYAGSPWHYAPFNSALGDLQSATFTVSTTASASLSEVNIFFPENQPTAVTIVPEMWLSLSVSTTDAPFAGGSASFNVKGPPTLVQPFGGVSFQSPLVGSTSFTVTNPASLARFQDTGTWQPDEPHHLAAIRVSIDGTTKFGSMSSTGSTLVTLTYEYRVPESGSAAALFLAALVVCAGVHRYGRGIA